MPTARRSETGVRAAIRSLSFAGQIALTILLGIALACSACERQAPLEADQEVDDTPGQQSESEQSPSAQRGDPKKSWEGYAVWYDVPDSSLAKRRAGKDELTAAHNRLRLGAMVRVTHLKNGKSVIVRITDRGVASRASIDLCKEAAEELGMISEGRARVRIDLLPDDKGVNAVSDSTVTAAQP
jgi:rare lipoprotein A (peptidoglycan hydrolase)